MDVNGKAHGLGVNGPLHGAVTREAVHDIDAVVKRLTDAHAAVGTFGHHGHREVHALRRWSLNNTSSGSAGLVDDYCPCCRIRLETGRIKPLLNGLCPA